jgi:hypothetical protein
MSRRRSAPHLAANIYRHEYVNLPTNLSVRSHIIYKPSFVLPNLFIEGTRKYRVRGLQPPITRMITRLIYRENYFYLYYGIGWLFT